MQNVDMRKKKRIAKENVIGFIRKHSHVILKLSNIPARSICTDQKLFVYLKELHPPGNNAAGGQIRRMIFVAQIFTCKYAGNRNIR